MNNPPYTTGGHRDWDLIAAMLFFIACCLLVSLVLPYRHYGVPAGHAAAEQLPAPRRRPSLSSPARNRKTRPWPLIEKACKRCGPIITRPR